MSFFEDSALIQKYIYVVGGQLEGFKQVKRNLFNCRCPVCGDSKKDKTKKRFYFYEKEGKHLVSCHNCGFSTTFVSFIKNELPNVYKDFVMDGVRMTPQERKQIEDEHPEEVITKRPVFKKVTVEVPEEKSSKIDPRLGTPLLSLAVDHLARNTMESRLIPGHKLAEMTYTPNFKKVAEYVNPDDPESTKNLRRDDERVVIPFYDDKGELYAIQGRALHNWQKPKYITIKVDEANGKIYNEYNVNPNLPVIVVEGPIDSMFLPNCVATCDANLLKADGEIYVFDNQPRNKDLIKCMQKAVDAGVKVCYWPSTTKEKDINDMVLNGKSRSDILKTILANSYGGLRGKQMFLKWKKV